MSEFHSYLGEETLSSAYDYYPRSQWQELAPLTPLPVQSGDLKALASLGDPIDVAEADAIYRPLTALLQLRFNAHRALAQAQQQFFAPASQGFCQAPTSSAGTDTPSASPKIPFIIGISGSVAVGKSTTARLLRHLLARWETSPKVALVTTDGFLYPNAVLNERGIMGRKGFPESYNRKALIHFLAQVKSGAASVKAPIYSHVTYDILPDEYVEIECPDILIIEGVNVLQPAPVSAPARSSDPCQPTPDDDDTWLRSTPNRALAVSDFFDFSIYVDAEVSDIRDWYVDRFLKLRQTAFTNPESYFQHYAALTDSQAREKALEIWHRVNLPNLEQQILPTRSRATLIIRKDATHKVSGVLLRKI